MASATKYVAVYSRMLVSSILQIREEDDVSLAQRLPKLVVCLSVSPSFV